MKRILVLMSILFLIAVQDQAFCEPSAPTPPVAGITPRSETLFGDTRIDNYFWLRERKNPEVRRYIDAENAYTAEIMKPLNPFEEKLFNEMVSRIKETDQAPPYREGDYYYYSRTEKGKQYPIYCRRKGTMSAPEETYFDQNEMAKGFSFYGLLQRAPSPDGNVLAYSVDTSGAENYVLHFNDLKTGAILGDHIEHTQALTWAADNRTIFYTVEDATQRPYRVYRHTLGTDSSKDQMVFEEKDTLYTLNLGRSRDFKYNFIGSSSYDSNEWRSIPASSPSDPPTLITPRRHGHEYDVNHWGGYFYIRTNLGARTFRLMRAPVSEPDEKNWREVIQWRNDVTIESMNFFSHYMVVYERQKGLEKMRVQNLISSDVHYIEFPEPVYTISADVNKVFDTHIFRLRYESLTTPQSIFDYDMEKREKKLVKRQEVLGGYEPSAYQAERIFAQARDGVAVPISLVYKKGVKLDGTAPLHLTGYGAYGSSSDPGFSSTRISYLDRGVIYAIAHVRGGGDMGREWYDEGKLLKKKNTFTDFISCAEHLINNRYTCSERLTISGSSAGGLLMGAVTNMRPDLFKAVIAIVPFVDVLNSMLDPTLMFTEQEYLEWGNPHEKVYYEYMKSYDPYVNVKAQAYPNILVRVGFNDPRVNYWEGAKWVARLRALKTDHNTVLLKVTMGQGHVGSTGRYDRLREKAFDCTYILSQYGITR